MSRVIWTRIRLSGQNGIVDGLFRQTLTPGTFSICSLINKPCAFSLICMFFLLLSNTRHLPELYSGNYIIDPEGGGMETKKRKKKKLLHGFVNHLILELGKVYQIVNALSSALPDLRVWNEIALNILCADIFSGRGGGEFIARTS